MQVIVAVSEYTPQENDVLCFLGGGITNCWEWQNAVIEELGKYNIDNLVIFNPRRADFPIHDPNASNEQISWEFKWLEACDIFSMYFCQSEESNQPICLYELGRNLIKMENKFPEDFVDRIVITSEEGYSRIQDVQIQSKLALGKDIMTKRPNAKSHAEMIVASYKKIMASR